MRVFYLIGLLLIGLHAGGPMIDGMNVQIPALYGEKRGDEVFIPLSFVLEHSKKLSQYFGSSGQRYAAVTACADISRALLEPYQKEKASFYQPIDFKLLFMRTDDRILTEVVQLKKEDQIYVVMKFSDCSKTPIQVENSSSNWVMV